MKDVDSIYRHINPLIHRYLLDTATMHSKDIHLRPFTYNLDVFSSCFNPRHISSANATSSHNTISTLPTPSIFYHYPIRFSSALPISPLVLLDSPLPSISVPPDNITWLYFDSIHHSFRSYLQPWPDGIVKHCMLETDPLHFRIATYFHSNSYLHFTTFPHLFHHLHRLHRLHHRNPLSSALDFRIKPSNHRSISFISGHQSCHYGADFDALTRDAYVYRQSGLSSIGHQDNHTRYDRHTLQVNNDK